MWSTLFKVSAYVCPSIYLCLFAYLSVCQPAAFNLAWNLWSLRDTELIFGMHNLSADINLAHYVTLTLCGGHRDRMGLKHILFILLIKALNPLRCFSLFLCLFRWIIWMVIGQECFWVWKVLSSNILGLVELRTCR